jgi:tetratricopeptide (TPR) repeat protein
MLFGCRIFFLLILVASHNVPVAILTIQDSESAPQVASQTGQNLDNLKRAAIEAQRVAEADPSEANLFLYASSLMKLDYHSAEIIYRFAVDKYPGSVRLHAGLASALEAQSDHDGAAMELYTAAELAPTDPHPLEFLVAAHYIPEALSQKVANGLRRLHRLYPQDGLILLDYEMVLANRYTDSSSPVPPDFVAILKEALQLTPRLPEAYFQLGLVYDERKAYAEEVQALRRAVQLSPLDEHYRYHLAMAYKRLGNNDAFLKEMSIFQNMHRRSSGVKSVY